MTVSTESNSQTYTGTGANTALSTVFSFDAAADLIVTQRVTATGVETVMVLTTDYLVTGGSFAIGTVTPVDGATDFPTTVTWKIERNTPQTQNTDYVENDPFAAESHEQALDKLTYITQDRTGIVNRALKVPTTDDPPADLPNSVDRASLLLGFDTGGDPIAVTDTLTGVIATAFGISLVQSSNAAAGRVVMDSQQDVITTRGDLVRGSSAAVAERLALGAASQMLVSDGTDQAWQTYTPENMILNGAMNVHQRVGPHDSTATYPNDDNTYCLDQVVLLSDGNDVADITSNEAPGPEQFARKMKALVATGDKKFGFLFPIESGSCAAALGGSQVVSAGFVAKSDVAGEFENLRMGVMSWTGARDSFSSTDVVSSWEAEGSDPILISNWNYENVPTNLPLTNVQTLYKVENVAIDTSNTVNLALFIWTDDTDLDVGDVLQITGVQMNVGATLAPFQHIPFATELEECKRYFVKSFDYTVEPAQNLSDDNGALLIRINTTTGVDVGVVSRFPVTMRTGAPTMTYYSIGAATSDWWNATATAQASGASSSAGLGDSGVYIQNPLVANDTLGDLVEIHYTAEAVL